MPLVYQSSLATPGDSTTSASPGTEIDRWFLKAGLRNVYFQAFQMQGKGSQLSTISGILARIIKWGTASTVGTPFTPSSNDPAVSAATATAASLPTSGTTRTNRIVIGCGATGPGQWIARDQDSYIVLSGGGAFSIDAMDVSNTASMKYEWSFEHGE